MNVRQACLAVFGVIASVAVFASAQGRLAHVFQDNMVLQREKPVPVWGWAEPGEAVTVRFAGQTVQATADADGYWKATLSPLATSTVGRDLAVRIGEEMITRRNVLVGEVWLAAGQSNMNHAGPDRATGVYPHYVSSAQPGKPEIRIMQFGWGASQEPLADIDPIRRGDSPWTTLTEDPPAKTMNLSRYFARVVRDGLNVPVGIVHVAVSGTNQAAWMARQTLETFPGKGGHENFYREFFATAETKLAKNTGEIRSWDDFQQVESDWRKTQKGHWPARKFALRIYAFPSTLYNTRVHTVAPFALRGVIWHQGESGPGGPYGRRLVAMITQWRKLFGQDFAFVWGTLSRNTSATPPLEPTLSWFYRSNTNLEIRKALDLFGKAPNVGLVEFYDVGHSDTHFRQKAEAGRRMGLAALTVAYGQEHVYTGPRLVKSEIEGAKALLRFDHVGKGIVYTPSIEGISGVIVKGPQGPRHWAEVRVVDPKTIEVWHPDITEIETIAYGVAVNPHETLFNSEGLPASPIRIKTSPIPYKTTGVAMVKVLGDRKAAQLNLTHVRRDGYIFQLLKRKAAKNATAPVQAVISNEWAEVEVLIDGKPIAVEEVTQGDRDFVTFDAPVNGPWIIVTEKGKADAFKDIDRY